MARDPITQRWDEALARWREPYRTEPARIARLAARPPVTIIERRVGGLRGKRAVELGCGGGSLGLACALRGASVLLLDSAQAALDSARQNLEDLEAAKGVRLAVEMDQADLFSYQTSLPFDLCVSDGLIEHWLERSDRIAVLTAHVRLVRPGGVVAVCIPNNVHPWMNRWERLGWPWTQPDCPLREVKCSPQELADELSQAGLVDVEVEGYMVWDMFSKWPKRAGTRLLVQGLKLTMGYDQICRVAMPHGFRLKYGTWLVATGLVPNA